jgi:hypothetical protein
MGEEFPDSELARQVSGPGVAVMGGSTISLIAVEQLLAAEHQRQHLSRYGEVQVHQDGTVTIRGRQWMRCSVGQRWEPVPGQSAEGTCTGEALRANWDDTHRLAREMNQSGGFAGSYDWRLPTIEELAGLRLCSYGVTTGTVDLGKANDFGACDWRYERPTIDTQVFPNTPSWVFWSGSHDTISSNNAWGVGFEDGDVGTLGRDHDFSRSSRARRTVILDAQWQGWSPAQCAPSL